MRITNKLSISGLGLALVMNSGVLAAPAADFVAKLASEDRPLEDRQRDGARRPYQVINLLGISEGMTVVDVGAGGGWYTRVLSAAVGPSGKVYMQQGPRGLQQNGGAAFTALAASLGNVEVSFDNLGDMPANIADAAVTALNIHHNNDERGTAVMQELAHVLKVGAVAAVIDHIATEASPANSHRIDPERVKRWIAAAGLELVTESDILRTAADDHTLSVDAPELGRNVDRFLFVVRKPR
jgi:predicted methyltransferase